MKFDRCWSDVIECSSLACTRGKDVFETLVSKKFEISTLLDEIRARS